MIGVIFAFLFFGFCTLVLVLEARKLWRSSAEEILNLRGGGSTPGLQRRLRLALPAGLLLCISFFGLTLTAVIDLAGANVPGDVYLFFLVLLGLASILAFLAVTFGVPRLLVLPAFRSSDAFHRAIRGENSINTNRPGSNWQP
jgi:hypothetical protein